MNPKDRVKNNLVALSSAAVFTVYAAGFVRTRPAAQRFAQQAERRPAPATRISADTPASTPTSVDRSEPAQASPAPAEHQPNHTANDARPTIPAKPSAPPAAAPTHSADSTAAVVTPTPTPAPQAPASVSAPVVTTPAPAPAVPATPMRDTSHAVVAPPTADSAQSGDKEKAKIKDGIFFGWGTSRHGDIQAGIEIKNGRIVSAFINECLTQYSCSWIAALPGQVIARQSADVDYVSGATQSSNAFYYAVSDALKKAK